MELKPTLAMSKTGHVTWYEPDSLGGFDVYQIAAPIDAGTHDFREALREWYCRCDKWEAKP